MEKKTPETPASEQKGMQQVKYPQDRTETNHVHLDATKGCGIEMDMVRQQAADVELGRLEMVAQQDHPGLCALLEAEAQHPTLIYRALENQTQQCGSCLFAEPTMGSKIFGDMECRMNPPGSGGNYPHVSKFTPMCGNHEIDPGWSTSAFAMLLKQNNEQSKAMRMLDIHRIEAIHKWEDVTGREWPKDVGQDKSVEYKADVSDVSMADMSDVLIEQSAAAIAASMLPWEPPTGILKFKGQAPDPEKLEAFKKEHDRLMVPASSVKEMWDQSEMQYWSEQEGQWTKEPPKESAVAKGASGEAPTPSVPKDEPVPDTNPYKTAPEPVKEASINKEACDDKAALRAQILQMLPRFPDAQDRIENQGLTGKEAPAPVTKPETSESQKLKALYERLPFLKVRTGELPVATYALHGVNFQFYADSKPSEPAIEVIYRFDDITLFDQICLSLEVWQDGMARFRFVADRLPVLEYHSGRYAFAYDTMASENPWTCKINDDPWVELSTMYNHLPIVLQELHRQMLRQFRARIEEAASVFEARDNDVKCWPATPA